MRSFAGPVELSQEPAAGISPELCTDANFKSGNVKRATVSQPLMLTSVAVAAKPNVGIMAASAENLLGEVLFIIILLRDASPYPP